MNQLQSMTERTLKKVHLRRITLTHGWPHVIAWFHRLCGVGLVVYIGIHILTLSALRYPEKFEMQMKIYHGGAFWVLELILALLVIFHSLNGGRLILFEIFMNRKDDLLIKWVVGLSAGYVTLLWLLMTMGDQSVTALVFWLFSTAIATCMAMITLNRLHQSGSGVFWKTQRVSATYLLLMVPAHMLFMHLNASIGRDTQTIIERMHHPFIKFVDLTLVIGGLFHGSYGLISIQQDYLKSNRLRICFGVPVFLVMIILFWVSIQLILTV
jgi:succinate dehydrogenase hydrophobic membrane anchor protein